MSRILIADPQPFMRAALRQRLAEAGHEVIGEAGDGREALERVKRLHPDLLILELDLPRLGGMELLRRLHHDWPQQKSLVFTHLPAAHYQGLSLEAGARGFVHKDERPEELDDAVRLVLGGRKVFAAQPPHPGSETPGAEDHITPRELTVLRYLSQGYRVKDIAEELAISDRTVSTYKARLLEKTQTDSLVDLVQAAKVKGLLNNNVVESLVRAPAEPSSKTRDLARLFDILPSPISLWSREGELLACNRYFLQAYGKSEEQLLGARMFELGVVSEEDAVLARREFLTGAAGDKPFTQVIAGNLRGRHRIIRLIGVPLCEDSGESIGVVCSFVDITERELEVQRLQEAKAYLDGLRATRARYLQYSFDDLLEEARHLQQLLPASSQRNTDPDHLAIGIGRIEEKLLILRELLRIESGSEPTVPQVYEMNQLTASLLADLPLQATATAQFAWVDSARYRNLLKALLFSFERSALIVQEAQASVENLPHGELLWRLNFLLAPQEHLAEHLASLEDRPSLQLVRLLCDVFAGSFQSGQAGDPPSAGLIQLKLVRSSSPH
ncbi:response regulator [Pseudomonas nitroreducens]|uniref:response regulator n=1 Tax=Pseudomonas nitroreducens TaxID=46680 RepID=UPI0020A09779|nr:response regulator [Pseudomonas nitroreducens]MCP1624975.1 PAS domain S-box-containing protein [Pseudomonas nitroreducens]